VRRERLSRKEIRGREGNRERRIKGVSSFSCFLLCGEGRDREEGEGRKSGEKKKRGGEKREGERSKKEERERDSRRDEEGRVREEKK